ncbi:Hsp20/alpha crystallin family protein [Saccharomonospora sp.]|uniref:Hsp20/alpha crystallin family protein n=1 Tax=Saccharomonospora sp. TaxID=33913 RepID=UPI0026216C67|nr:Hsp20/alpha crystallin family protein [Saccharomonospora sp.]
MSLPTRPFSRSLFPDFRDMFDMLPSLSGLRPAMDMHSIRIEDKIEGDTYIIRAELPGIDVENDLDISVHDNLLTIEAQRSEEQAENGRSEFRYGSFTRTVALPNGAQEDSIDASYQDGILTVRVKLSKPEEKKGRQIPVRHG